MTRGRWLALVAALVVAAAVLLGVRSHRAVSAGYVVPPPSRDPAPVVVTIVVDQFAAWVAEERLPLLPADGGFARLRREGTWVTRMELAHSITETGPGHSSLYTGVTPARSGIMANEVCGEAGKTVPIVRDASVALILPSGERDGPGASLVRLRVPVLADRLREAHPDAVILSVSLKDRGTVFGGGHKPDVALWWDKELDMFVTSTAFATEFPDWARQLGTHEALVAARAEPWTLLDEEWVRAHAATADEQDGEGDLWGFGTVFPHDFARTTRPPQAFRASPTADRTVLALALAALDTHRRNVPLLLAISLSANDYIGHTFGPDSWEAWDELRRLDTELGDFFTALDARFGPGGWSAVLAADHGTISMPEVAAAHRSWCAPGAPADPYHRPCSAQPRLFADALAEELRATAAHLLGPGNWITCVSEPYVYPTAEALALPIERRRALFDALATQIRTHDQVADVIRTDELPADCPGEDDDSIPALVCRSVDHSAPPALYVVVRPDAFFDADVVPGKGSDHDSPYAFDLTVPLLVRAPGRVAAGRVVRKPVSFRAFSATAAALLGLDPPAKGQ